MHGGTAEMRAESGFTTIFLCASRAGTLVYGTLSGGVMVAQESLELFVMVRIHAGQPVNGI